MKAPFLPDTLGAIPGRIDVDREKRGFGYAVLADNPVDPVQVVSELGFAAK